MLPTNFPPSVRRSSNIPESADQLLKFSHRDISIYIYIWTPIQRQGVIYGGHKVGKKTLTEEMAKCTKWKCKQQRNVHIHPYIPWNRQDDCATMPNMPLTKGRRWWRRRTVGGGGGGGHGHGPTASGPTNGKTLKVLKGYLHILWPNINAADYETSYCLNGWQCCQNCITGNTG